MGAANRVEGVLWLTAWAIGCFAIGSMSPATWIASALGTDVRAAGSRNPGATNAGRLLGVRWGVLVGVLDVLKGYVPTAVLAATIGATPAIVGGVAVVLGHVFSPLLRGRGGKGVATTLGVLLALAPWAALGGMVVFASWFALARRVGEASVAAAVAVMAIGMAGLVGVVTWVAPRALGAAVALLGLVVVGRHGRNIADAWSRLGR